MEEAKAEDASSSERVKVGAKEIPRDTPEGGVAASDKQKVEGTPTEEPHMVPPTETLTAAPS